MPAARLGGGGGRRAGAAEDRRALRAGAGERLAPWTPPAGGPAETPAARPPSSAPRRVRPLLAAVLVAAAPLPAAAQGEPAAPAAMTGTLRKIQEAGSVAVGHREASLPFSFLDARGQPVGYSIDLCREIVDAVAEELGFARLPIAWRPVTPESRIAAVVSGQVDLECGSTTNTPERARQVAFSPVFFVTGTKIMVRHDSPARALRDLAGRTVVASAGTTNEASVRTLSERGNLGIRVVTATDHAASFARLAEGRADAFASDDVLLHGFIATAPGGSGFRVTGEFLSYDPYGIMFRKDDAPFAAVVERAFARMAETRRLRELYTRWFLRRLPNGQRLDVPLSPELEAVFRALGEPR